MNAKTLNRLDAKLGDIYDEIEMSDTNATDYHILRAIIGLMDALQIIKKELAASGEPDHGQPGAAVQQLETGIAADTSGSGSGS